VLCRFVRDPNLADSVKSRFDIAPNESTSIAMPTPETANENAAFQRMLEEFVAGNVDLQRLENALRKFNLFDSLKLVWQEVKHSDFLAYLLDPQQNHGLGDIFLKSLLQSVLKGGIQLRHAD
jgi:hypothetical protein